MTPWAQNRQGLLGMRRAAGCRSLTTSRLRAGRCDDSSAEDSHRGTSSSEALVDVSYTGPVLSDTAPKEMPPTEKFGLNCLDWAVSGYRRMILLMYTRGGRVMG